MASIFVPSDFSKNSVTALRYAIQLNKTLKYDLVVFHASQISAYAIASAGTEKEKKELFRQDEKDKHEKLYDQVLKAYKYWGINKMPPNTTLLVEYTPMMVERSIEVAEKQQAALIVMGTHGATGITKFFFGSNTSVMISKSGIPVLAVPEKYNIRKPEHLLFSSDLEKTQSEISQILPLVQALKARLTVLYMDYGIDLNTKKWEDAEAAIKKLSYKKIKLISRKANIEETLVDQLKKAREKLKPDMLVMFTRERTLWDRLFMKSKTEDLSTSIKIPLLSFKKK